MFSFHKPKIYRSLHGCCICRAKSSSSRFTDSKRYEDDFDQCFGIDEHRAGEICNACVLLVKRWKKLPPGSNRNWHHVVDARAGPGTKSMYKIKNRSNKELPEDHSIIKKKHKHKHKYKKRTPASALLDDPSKPPQSPGGLSDDIVLGDEGFSDQYLSRTPSPGNSDVSDDEDDKTSQKSVSVSSTGCQRRKQSQPTKNRVSSFLDLSYWKQTTICCGVVWKGPYGELMVDPRLLRPCCSLKSLSTAASKPCTRSQTTRPSPHKPRRQNSESCASSDSGVSTPPGDQDEMSLDGLVYPSQPKLPRADLPPDHLVPDYNLEDQDDLDEEEDDASFLPPVMPHFLSTVQGASTEHYKPSVYDLDGDDSMMSTDETTAAATAVLDLSMGLSRQRFIPTHV